MRKEQTGWWIGRGYRTDRGVAEGAVVQIATQGSNVCFRKGAFAQRLRLHMAQNLILHSENSSVNREIAE